MTTKRQTDLFNKFSLSSNFNHERGIICIRACRYMRVIYEETMIWVHLREVFGKKLVEQPVIRAKLAKMLVRVEAAQ